MKLRLMSDLHTEFTLNKFIDFQVKEEDKDIILILAGDIGVGTSAYKQVSFFSKHYKHVIYIAGNHEFYYNTVGITEYDIKTMFESDFDNVSVLIDDCLVLDDVNFWGGTFWSDSSDSSNPLFDYQVKRSMTDYKVIKRINESTGKSVTFEPSCQAYHHKKSFKSLDKWICTNKYKKKVVITHHAPSDLSSLDCYKGSIINKCFYTDYEQYITQNDINLWCHGHMHNSSDYLLGDTRVVANPFGYTGMNINKNFDAKLILEV